MTYISRTQIILFGHFGFRKIRSKSCDQ